jgi:DNA-binding CsgD family transcriptional regulator
MTDAARFRIGETVCGYLVIGRQDPHIAGLTQAESDVVALLSSGCSNGEIAARRGTSVRTVGNQLSAIFKKLGLSSRNELVELATGLPRRPNP